jgi:hypothetical protein
LGIYKRGIAYRGAYTESALYAYWTSGVRIGVEKFLLNFDLISLRYFKQKLLHKSVSLRFQWESLSISMPCDTTQTDHHARTSPLQSPPLVPSIYITPEGILPPTPFLLTPHSPFNSPPPRPLYSLITTTTSGQTTPVQPNSRSPTAYPPRTPAPRLPSGPHTTRPRRGERGNWRVLRGRACGIMGRGGRRCRGGEALFAGGVWA